jgi:hypothetical protein
MEEGLAGFTGFALVQLTSRNANAKRGMMKRWDLFIAGQQ